MKKESRFPFYAFRTGVWRAFLPVTLARELRLKGGECNYSSAYARREAGFTGHPFYLSLYL